jgi:hypothetical protein
MEKNVRNASERDVGAPHQCLGYFSEMGVCKMDSPFRGMFEKILWGDDA